jgi:hypothetical protein
MNIEIIQNQQIIIINYSKMKYIKFNYYNFFQALIVTLLLVLGSTKIDAQIKVGNNPKTLAHNVILELEATSGNPAVFSKDSAYLGIGTLTPTRRLEIQSPTAGAVKIVDGTQADGKVLTSDANGVATWKVPFSATSQNLTNSNGIIITGGTGATLTAASLRLDSTAVAKMITQSPVKDSINVLINAQTITVKNVSIKLPLMSVGDVGSKDYILAGVAIGDNVIANPRLPLPYGVNLAYVMVSAANTITFGFTGTASNTAVDIPFDIKVLK